MKEFFKKYYQPTPKTLRKFSDALLGTALFITGYGVIMEHKTVAIVCIIIGGIAKFGANFFSDA